MRHKRPGTFDRFGIIQAGEAPALGVGQSSLSTAVRRGSLTHPHRGVYRQVDADAQDTHARLRAALVHLGEEAVGVLGSAAIVHGLEGLPRRWTPQVAVPPGLERQQRDGMTIHVWDLPADQVTVVEGMSVTTVVRTIADACRLLSREHAVALTDSALNRRLLAPDDLDDVMALMARRRNCVAGRRRLGEARLGAQSPGETRVRLIASDAGLPPDELQMPLHDPDGHVLGYGDLGYRLPGGGLLMVEFDGRSVHEQPEALLGDRRRQNALLAQPGTIVLRFAWEDTYSPKSIVTALRSVLGPAGWKPGTAPQATRRS